jgi:DNA-binding NarL/FixJ family response regulator
VISDNLYIHPSIIGAISENLKSWGSRSIPDIDSGNLRSFLDEVSERTQMLQRLSARESEALFHVMRGLTNRQIAKHMQIAESTVAFHLYNINRKLVVESRTQAALVALMSFISVETH